MIDNADVETEARVLLRERIKRLPWHSGLPERERWKRIDEDVERYWRVMVPEVARNLIDRAFGQLAA